MESGPLVQSASDVYICRDCASRSQAMLEQAEGLRTKDAVCSFCKQPPSEARALVEASNHSAFICLDCAKLFQSTIDQQRERRPKIQFSLGQVVALVLLCGTGFGLLRLLRWAEPEAIGLNPVFDMILVFAMSALAVWHRETRLAIVALVGAVGGSSLPVHLLFNLDWADEYSRSEERRVGKECRL